MNKTLFLYLLFLSNIFGGMIIHEKVQVASYGISIPIRAFLDVSEKDIHRFSLLYRPYGNIEYVETPMIQMGKSIYFAEIPGEFIIRDYLEYYLLLEMSNKTKTFFPVDDAVQNPIRINIDISEKEQSMKNTEDSSSDYIQDFDIVGLTPEVVIISPKPGERIKRRDLFIALSYFPMKNVDPSRVKVYIDNIDISDKAAIDSSYLSVPTKDIMPGIHTIRVNITNIFGQKYNDISWSFTVLPKEILYFDVIKGKILNLGAIKKQSGQLRANYTGGHVDQSINIGEINFLYNIGFDWLLMDAYYSKSSIENEFDQPRDRYYVYFSNDFMKIKLGDSYPFIDDYAWNGRRVRGMNFSFEKKPLSVDVVNGKTAWAVQGNPEKNAMVISAIDSTTDNWGITASRNNYTFQQDVSAAKVGLTIGKKFHWDMNYIKVQDNIPTVMQEIPNAKIVIPDSLVNRKQSDDYFTISISDSDTVYTIRFDSLKNNVSNIFDENDTLYFSSTNWVGQKPKDNFILGSNLQLGFDDSRILLKSGYSLSLLNQNKWNNLQHISELDTFAYDTKSDDKFLDYVPLDVSQELSQYESYFNFSNNGQPLIPFMLKKDGIGIIDFLNLSNLSRYSKLQLRYLGHRVELGSKQNGPDYYSLLNPYLKTNYKENYFSDRLNLFQNKLLLFFKKSIITEGIYVEQKTSIKTKKSLFNISLYPGVGLPTFNFGFLSDNRSNGIKNIHYIDVIVSDTVLTDTLDRRIDILSKQLSISMTNRFQLWVNQVLSVNLLFLDQEDLVAKSHTQSTGYFPLDAASESYGISVKSVYNRHWESTVYFNSSHYEYGQKGFDNSQEQVLNNYQLKLINHPHKYFKKLMYNIYYSTGRGTYYYTQYNFNMGIISEPLDRVKLIFFVDYRIKYLDSEMEGDNDLFFRAKLEYDIK